MKTVIWLWLGGCNLAAFLMMGADKRRAKRGRWRIPEATLLWAAALGGSVGALLGMRVFHHKTRKKKFSAGVPVLLLLQAALAVFLWLRGIL